MSYSYYPGSESCIKWLFQTLINDDILVELLGHKEESPTITRGTMHETQGVPHLSFTFMLGMTLARSSHVIAARERTIQFSYLFRDIASSDKVQRRINFLLDPATTPGMKLDGLLRVLYVNLVPFGSFPYEDTSRRCFRTDFRYEIGFLETH
jgi:hypothetical protein